MKVCMLAYTFYENDNRVRKYAEALAQENCHVDVVALRRNNFAQKETINGVKVYRIQGRVLNEKGKLSHLYRHLKFFIKSAFSLSRLHIKNHYDVVHVHSIPDFEVFAAALPKLTGAKIILDIHDLVPEFYANKFEAGNKSFAFKSLAFIEKISCKFSDHVIISNHLWEKTLKARSVEENKCTTILNYPDSYFFSNNIPRIKNEQIKILYPGTLNHHQGLDIAVRAFNLIKDRVPEASLHIYGEGPAKGELSSLIKELCLENKVHLKEPVSFDKIATIMANSDIGIIPKRNDSFGGEAFSTKTLEFMSLGVPIIVSRTKIDSYYFNDSIVSFFEPENERDLAEAMLLLIKNQKSREELAENALKFVEKNTWDVKKRMYLDLVDTLVNHRIHSGIS